MQISWQVRLSGLPAAWAAIDRGAGGAAHEPGVGPATEGLRTFVIPIERLVGLLRGREVGYFYALDQFKASCLFFISGFVLFCQVVHF